MLRTLLTTIISKTTISRTLYIRNKTLEHIKINRRKLHSKKTNSITKRFLKFLSLLYFITVQYSEWHIGNGKWYTIIYQSKTDFKKNQKRGPVHSLIFMKLTYSLSLKLYKNDLKKKNKLSNLYVIASVIFMCYFIFLFT